MFEFHENRLYNSQSLQGFLVARISRVVEDVEAPGGKSGNI